MAEEPGTLEQIALSLAGLFDPIVDVFDEEDEKKRNTAVRRLLAELGLLLPPESEKIAFYVGNPKEIYEKEIKQLWERLKSLDRISIAEAPAVFKEGKDMVAAVIKIKDDWTAIIEEHQLVAETQLVEFGKALPENLPYFLIIRYLEDHTKGFLPAMTFIGFVEIEEMKGDAFEEGEPVDDENFLYKRRRLNWDNLFGFFSDPTKKLEELF